MGGEERVCGFKRPPQCVPGYLGVITFTREPNSKNYSGEFTFCMWNHSRAVIYNYPDSFPTIEAAARAYDRVAIAYSGADRAHTNYPVEGDEGEEGGREGGKGIELSVGGKSFPHMGLHVLELRSKLPLACFKDAVTASDWVAWREGVWEEACTHALRRGDEGKRQIAQLGKRIKFLLEALDSDIVRPSQVDRFKRLLSDCDRVTEVGVKEEHWATEDELPHCWSCCVARARRSGGASPEQRRRQIRHGSVCLVAMIKAIQWEMVSWDAVKAREGGKDAAGAAMREDAIMMDLFARGLKQLKGEGESTPLVKAAAPRRRAFLGGNKGRQRANTAQQHQHQQQQQQQQRERERGGDGNGDAGPSSGATSANGASGAVVAKGRGKWRGPSSAFRPARVGHLVPEGLRVVVIGAGPSGCKAAFDLHRMGAHVTILEGRDRVGGRIHSWRMKTGAAATGNDTVAAAGNDDVTRATDGAAMGATDAAAMRAADEAAMRERGTDAATTREPATDAASRSPDAATAPAPNTATAPAAPVPLISPSMVTSTVTVDLGASYICGTSRNPPCNPILEYCVDKLGLEIRPKFRDSAKHVAFFGSDGRRVPDKTVTRVMARYDAIMDALLEMSDESWCTPDVTMQEAVDRLMRQGVGGGGKRGGGAAKRGGGRRGVGRNGGSGNDTGTGNGAGNGNAGGDGNGRDAGGGTNANAGGGGGNGGSGGNGNGNGNGDADADVESQIIDALFSDLYVAPMDALSLTGMVSEGFEGDHELVMGGFKQMIDAILDGTPPDNAPKNPDLAIRDKVLLSHKVTQIQTVPGGVLVHCEGIDRPFAAHCVVCTLPLGVLQKGAVQFTPPLPEFKSEAIRRLGMGTENRVMLTFPRQFWPKGPHFLRPLGECRYTFISLAEMGVGNAMWCHVRPFAITEVEAMTDEEAVEDVMGQLRKMFGDDIPDPIDSKVTRWQSDPFCYGAYSYVPRGCPKEAYKDMSLPVACDPATDALCRKRKHASDVIARERNVRVFFAGEATSPEDSYTVHGAYASGAREAERVKRWWGANGAGLLRDFRVTEHEVVEAEEQ